MKAWLSSDESNHMILEGLEVMNFSYIEVVYWISWKFYQLSPISVGHKGWWASVVVEMKQNCVWV